MTEQRPSPVDLHSALRRWRRSHRIWILTGVVAATIAWVLLVLLVSSGEAESAGDRSPLRWPLTTIASSAALTAIVATIAGHVATGGLRWPRHVARLPFLLRDVWRRASRPLRPTLAGVAIGAVAAVYLHPPLMLGLAGISVGLGVTDVGLAAVHGSHRGVTARSLASRRLAVVMGGLAAGVVAVGRLATLDAACVTERLLAAPCSANTALVTVLAIAGAVVAVPLFLALGTLVSVTLDGRELRELSGRDTSSPSDRAAPLTEAPSARQEPAEPSPVPPEPDERAEPAATEPAPDEPPPERTEPERPTEEAQRPPPTAPRPAPQPIVAPHSNHQEELFATAALSQVDTGGDHEDGDHEEADLNRPDEPAPDPDATDEVPTIRDTGAETEEPAPSSAPEGPATPAVNHGEDHLDQLRSQLDDLSPETRAHVEPVLDALSDLTPARTRELIDQVASHEATIATLRAQYRRAPGIARSAIERACVTGLRGAGVDEDHAQRLSTALLTLDEADWDVLRDALSPQDQTRARRKGE